MPTEHSTSDQVDPTPIGIIDTSGTPGYMAPEAMCQLHHGPAADFFAIGVMVYEQMFRKRPYGGASKQQIRDNILARQVQIKAYDIPKNWSIEAADFANKLIRRKAANRLGFYKGVAELKDHPWFVDFDWEALASKKMKAPWVPPKGDNYLGKKTEFVNEDDLLLAEAEILIKRESVQNLFSGYFYDSKLMEQQSTTERI